MSESRAVLITGASSGFGKETVSLLADRGFSVHGTSRNPVEATGNGHKMLELDVDSDDSVNVCVSRFLEEAGRLDVLVNDAGYVLTGGVEGTSLEEAKAQFETIFFGQLG